MRVRDCDDIEVFAFGPRWSGNGVQTCIAGILWPRRLREIDDVKGYLYTGATKSIYFGDKPCENFQITGDLYPDSFLMAPYKWTMSNTGYQQDLVSWRPVWNPRQLLTTFPFIAQDCVGVEILLVQGPVYGGYYRCHTLFIESCDDDTIVYRSIQSDLAEPKPDSRVHSAPLKWFRRRDVSERIPLAEGTQADHRYLPWTRRISEASMRDILSIVTFGLDPIPKGDLCMEAVQDTRVININTLMYTKELFETFDLIKSTINSAVDLIHGNPKQIAKEISNLYLSYHYGYRLSIRDTEELIRASVKEINNLHRAQAFTRSMMTSEFTYPRPSSLAGFTVKAAHHCKVWYNQLDTSFSTLLRQLFRWDIFPELGNVYDMIPYSFVVDWFIPFGDILDKIDNHTYSHTLDVYSVEYSTSLTVAGLPVTLPFFQGMFRGYASPGLSLRYFNRWMEPELSFPPLELKLQAGPKNWFPAGALILQRI